MKFLIILILSYSINAGAQVGGQWIGWADWKYQGSGNHCSANLIFSETKETFNFQKGFLDCDIITLEIPEKIFLKSNDQLINENAVGKWNESHYEWSERYNDRTVINVSITIDASHMDYVEHWIQDQNTLLYDISGRLFRQ